MRILLTTDTIGGVWTFTKELVTAFLRQGHAVALVSLGRSPSAEQRAWCRLVSSCHKETFRYDASPAPLEWMNDNEGAYTIAEPLLLRIIKEFSVDLVHSNQFCFGRLPVAIPKVITAHSDVLSWAAVCRPEGLPGSPWLGRYMQLAGQGLSSADFTVAPTLWMLEALCLNFGPLRGEVISNGRTIPGKSLRIPLLQAVTVGRLWDEAKNLSILTKITSPVPLFIAGELTYEDFPISALPGGLMSLGILDEPSLLDLFRTSSIYIASSIYEPFGLAPLEAALCGCAVIANDIPSLREVWGDDALYFRGSEELTTLLAHLAAFPGVLAEARRRARQRALKYTAARTAESYLSLYRTLLAPVRVEEFASYVS